MTKYRTIQKHYTKYLQYLKEKYIKILWWKIDVSKWYFVPKPYYDWLEGREDIYDLKWERLYIHSNIENFIKEYPNIEDYWSIYNKEQSRLIEMANKKYYEFFKDHNKIEYLNN